MTMKHYNSLTNLMLELYRAYEGQGLESHERSRLVYQWLIQSVAEQFPGFQLHEDGLEYIQYYIPSALTFTAFVPASVRPGIVQHVLYEPFLSKFAQVVQAVKKNPNLRPS